MKANGKMTDPDEETLNALITAHFPNAVDKIRKQYTSDFFLLVPPTLMVRGEQSGRSTGIYGIYGIGLADDCCALVGGTNLG